MQTIPDDEFLKWAAGVGVGFDPRYPRSGELVLRPPGGPRRFWAPPPDTAQWPHFVGSLLEALDPWRRGYWRPRSGRWPSPGRSIGSRNDAVRDILLRGTGVPEGAAVALRCDADEVDTIAAIGFVFLAFGWHSEDDLCFVPDHGRQLVTTDHHGVVHVECDGIDRMLDFVEDMTEAGYGLPTEPPDWTFKWPEWMGPEPPEWRT